MAAADNFTYLITGGADRPGRSTSPAVMCWRSTTASSMRETKSSYQVEIQVTDDGAPNLS